MKSNWKLCKPIFPTCTILMLSAISIIGMKVEGKSSSPDRLAPVLKLLGKPMRQVQNELGGAKFLEGLVESGNTFLCVSLNDSERIYMSVRGPTELALSNQVQITSESNDMYTESNCRKSVSLIAILASLSVRPGVSRESVEKVYGVPTKEFPDSLTWRIEGRKHLSALTVRLKNNKIISIFISPATEESFDKTLRGTGITGFGQKIEPGH